MAYLVISSEKKSYEIVVKRGWASFTTPCYHELFVDDLKDAIPAGDWRYNGSTKTWSVHEIHLGTLEALVGEHWGEVRIVRAEMRRAA